MKVAIVGVTGYSGTVLWQLLSQHPNVTEINIYTTQADLKSWRNNLIGKLNSQCG